MDRSSKVAVVAQPPRAAVAEPQGALWELTITRVKEVLRDPMALFWTFGFPVFLAVVLGLAFRSTPPAPLPVGLVCAAADGCEAVRSRLSAAGQLAVRESSLSDALLALKRNKLDLVVEVEAGDALAYHYDNTRREAQTARLAVERGLDPTPLPYQIHDRPRLERGSRYIDFLMPGLVALNLMGSGVWGIGFAIVDARRRKLLRQLSTTPMKRSHFLLSYMFSRLFFLVPEVVFLFGFGALVLGTPIAGSLWTLALLNVLGALAFTGLGVLIAARADNTEVASGWGNLVMMPMWLFSGVFFSYEQFPEQLKPAIRALPLTALADALRAVSNEGAPLTACLSQLSVLSVWAALSFLLALRLFRWQ